MNTHTQINSEKESQLTLELLQAIEQRDDISQRHLAQKMGVALGLANSYLKRCVKKGFIKMKTAPANRYLYYLTPHGFSEKARLTGEFLTTSLTLFRQSGEDYTGIFSACIEASQKKILFAGLSDLTEIAYMRSLQSDVEVVGVFQNDPQSSLFIDVKVADNLAEFDHFDVVVMTSMEQTDELLDLLRTSLNEKQIIIPSLLLGMNYRNEVKQQNVNH